jgi:hypothetical protein
MIVLNCGLVNLLYSFNTLVTPQLSAPHPLDFYKPYPLYPLPLEKERGRRRKRGWRPS